MWDTCLWCKTLVTKYFSPHCLQWDFYSTFVSPTVTRGGHLFSDELLKQVLIPPCPLWGCFPGRRWQVLERQGCATQLWATPCLSLVWTVVCTLGWWDAASHGGACQLGWRVRSLCRWISLCLNRGIFANRCLPKAQGCPSQAKGLPSSGAKRSKMGFCENMAKVPHVIAAIHKIADFTCPVTGDARETFLPWKLVFSWPMPITIVAWLGFYEEGVMDALPSAQISLESPRSLGVSTLS